MILILTTEQLDDIQMKLYSIKEEYMDKRQLKRMNGWDHVYYNESIEKYEKILKNKSLDLSLF
jgi:hypothetical protein